MPIFNAGNKDVSTRVFGNYHTIKAGQIKNFQEDIERFMTVDRGYLGLVSVPEEFNDPEYRNSEQGRAELLEKRKEGVAKRIAHLQSVIHNETVSLKQDLEIANIKIDPLMLASKGVEDAMIELRDYQYNKNDEEKLKVERLRKLERQMQANSDSLINKPKKETEEKEKQ